MGTTLLRGTLLASLLIDVANTHSSARAEQLAHEVPRDRLAPILDPEKLAAAPGVRMGRRGLETEDGRRVSENEAHQLQNVLEKRIARGEIPAPCNISIATLLRVAGKLAELNADNLGAFAGLHKLAIYCRSSESHIRAVYAYLVEHGHALGLLRTSMDDRKIGGSREAGTDARTTVRLVFPITCEMSERLDDAAVIDMIARGEKRARAAQLDLPGVDDPRSASPLRIRNGKPTPPRPPAVALDPETLAPELRCLVEPLEELRRITGYLLPVTWAADESFRLGLIDLASGEPDHEWAAQVLTELGEKILEERRAADAMDLAHPKLRGGALGLMQRALSRFAWWANHREIRVYQLRDAARDRQEHASATPVRVATVAEPAADGAAIAAASEPRRGPPPPPTPTPVRKMTATEQRIAILRHHLGPLGARIFAARGEELARLEAERVAVELELQGLISGTSSTTGPPE